MKTDLFRATIDRFVVTSDEEFEQIINHFKVIQLAKNEIWEDIGKISQNLAFVNQGILRQYYIKDGNEYTDALFTECDFLGNYISYHTKEASSTYTEALEDAELITISFVEYEKLFEIFPITAKFSKLIGDQKLKVLNERSSSLLMDSPEERYYKFLEQKPELFNRIPQYMIAQYLGIRPESLSRIRKRHLS